MNSALLFSACFVVLFQSWDSFIFLFLFALKPAESRQTPLRAWVTLTVSICQSLLLLSSLFSLCMNDPHCCSQLDTTQKRSFCLHLLLMISSQHVDVPQGSIYRSLSSVKLSWTTAHIKTLLAFTGVLVSSTVVHLYMIHDQNDVAKRDLSDRHQSDLEIIALFIEVQVQAQGKNQSTQQTEADTAHPGRKHDHTHCYPQWECKLIIVSSLCDISLLQCSK